MYAIATRWTFKEGSGEEALGINKDDVMPAVESQPGYVHTVIVQTGSDSFLSFICWETEDDAKRTLEDLSSLVIRHLGHLVRDFERVPGTVVYEAYASGAVRRGA
jgi:hypothetical protein